jgi:hypothetical protein
MNNRRTEWSTDMKDTELRAAARHFEAAKPDPEELDKADEGLDDEEPTGDDEAGIVEDEEDLEDDTGGSPSR